MNHCENRVGFPITVWVRALNAGTGAIRVVLKRLVWMLFTDPAMIAVAFVFVGCFAALAIGPWNHFSFLCFHSKP